MLRDNQRRARNARLVFLLLIFVTGSLFLLSVLAQLWPEWASEVAAVSTDLVAALYYGFAFLGFSYILLAIASYVTLIMWLRRAYYNLHQVPTIRPEYSDGWAAGAWFVPFLNLVRPFTIMREVWQDTQKAAWGRIIEPATILGWWWAAFVLKMIIARISWQMGSAWDSATLTQDDMLATALDACSQLVAAALTWYIIGRCARFEEELVACQQVAKLGQPPLSTSSASLTDQADYALEEGY